MKFFLISALLVLHFVLLVNSASLMAEPIRLGSGSIDPALHEPSIPQSLRAPARVSGKDYYLVQFKSLPGESLIQQISRYAKVYTYIPDNTYLIQAEASNLGLIQSHAEVRWVGIYHPFYKLSPDIGKREFSPSRHQEGMYYLSVELFPDSNADESIAMMGDLGGKVLSVHSHGSSTRIKLLLPSSEIAKLASLPAVQWIEEESERKKRNSVTRWVIQSNVSNNTSIWNKGLHGENQIIGHIDGLLSSSSCYFGASGKVVAIHNQIGDSLVDPHGTHTAGTAVGDRSTFGTAGSGDGNAFAAKLAHTNLCDLDPLECGLNSPSLTTLEEALSDHHSDGARIHTNSWGDDSTRSYTTDCRDIDKFNHENEEDLVIFAVTNTSTLKTPENAKNVLAVAASKQAPNQAAFYSGGSGPTTDGRRKPEIYAPGQYIASAKTSCNTTKMSGTSMAAPAIAAGAAMIRQYYSEGWYPSGSKTTSDGFIPSGALLKATLLNGTVDMTGISGYPGNKEGWGRLLVDNALYFAGDPRGLIVRDVRNSSGFLTGSTATDTYNFTVASGQPLKITLVWTDPQSPVGAAGSLINNLNLEVTTSSGVFKGNVFGSGQSATGGTFDSVNNVEQVVVNSPGSGNLTVKVIAASIPQGRQGYALVLSGNFQGCSAPAAPSGLQVTAGTNQNSLVWNAVSGATYDVYRNTTGCGDSFAFLGSTSSTNYTDGSLTGGVTYYYQVVSKVGGCSSSPSSCQSGTPVSGGGGGTLFLDDFSDGDSLGWVFSGSGTHTVNAEKQFVITGASSLTAKPTFTGCDDCDLSIQLIIQSGKPAIYFPFIDSNNLRELRFHTDVNKVQFKERVNGVATLNLFFPFALPLGQTYLVTIVNTGGTVGITINGTPLSLPAMTNFPPASLKLESLNGTTHFDDVTVSQ